VFEFKGAAAVDAWVEVEIDGQRTRLGEVLGRHLLKAGLPEDSPSLSGYILWARAKQLKTGEKEVWRLAIGVQDKSGKITTWAADDDLRPPGSEVAYGIVTGSGTGHGYVMSDPEGVYTLYNAVERGSGSARRKVELRCRFHRGK
jgi:hypothetical protein